MSDAARILLAIGLPLAGALGIALTGRRPNLRESVTLVSAVALAWVVWGLLPSVLTGSTPAATAAELLPGIAIEFRVEPLGMLFAALASLLWIINSVYSIGYMRGNDEKHQTRFYACFAIALSATMGVALAGNLLTLFLFYEILTISTYPLVAHKGDAETVRSARVYIGILLTTSIALFLPAILWTWQVAGTLEFVPGGILADNLQGPALGLLLALYVFGIGKAAVMPVHRWLPAAMVAPTPVSALLHAVAVVKAGVFTITKVAIYTFGTETLFGGSGVEVLSWVAAFTLVAASVVALRQGNLKRLLAYSTIGQLAYVVLAALIARPLSELGAALHIVAHAFGKITLFFAAGSIYTASHKTELAQLDGIGRRMPWTMAAFAIGAISMIGLPPTAGFISKWYILAGALEAGDLVAVSAIIASTLLNAAYFLPLIFRAWFRRADETAGEPHGEAPLPIVLALLATAGLTLAFFFFHGTALELAQQLGGSGP